MERVQRAAGALYRPLSDQDLYERRRDRFNALRITLSQRSGFVHWQIWHALLGAKA